MSRKWPSCSIWSPTRSAARSEGERKGWGIDASVVLTKAICPLWAHYASPYWAQIRFAVWAQEEPRFNGALLSALANDQRRHAFTPPLPVQTPFGPDCIANSPSLQIASAPGGKSIA